MRFKIIHLAPATSDTQRPTPRWALRLAYALPLILLPTCLWRLPFAFEFRMGMVYQKPGHPALATLWITIPYVFSLSLLSEAAALLSIGLVRRWGEVAPKRLPLIGGRPIPPAAVLVPATLLGLVLTGVSVDMVLGWTGVIHAVGFTSPWWQALARACTAPTALWGPILLALSYAYYTRRCRPNVKTSPLDALQDPAS